MNKKVILKNISGVYLAFCLLAGLAFFTSCEDDDKSDSSPITVTSIHLSDADDEVPDRTLNYVRLGYLIRIEGSGFTGMQKIYINGVSAYFNTTLMSDNSMIIKVPNDAPTVEATEDVRNTIRFVKKGTEYTYNFDVRSAAPSISRISHTMPQAGEKITIYGSGLYEISKVTFPGGVTVTEGIESDNEEGTYCILKVPAGITEGGAILVEGSAGATYSPAYFNFKKGLLHNFDDVNNSSWGGGLISGNLTDVIPATGDGPKSQGIYRSFNKDKEVIPAPAAKASFYWANSAVWPTILTNSVIPVTTETSKVAVQFDVYFEGAWNSGTIRMVIADGYGTDRYCMLYTPWLVNGKITEFENPGSWYTVTLPFSNSADFVDKTFESVLNAVNGASYKQWGPWFDNIKIDDIEPEPTNVVVYFDNLRVVPLEVPAYNEFGDE